jgi:hypothetical protein
MNGVIVGYAETTGNNAWNTIRRQIQIDGGYVHSGSKNILEFYNNSYPGGNWQVKEVRVSRADTGEVILYDPESYGYSYGQGTDHQETKGYYLPHIPGSVVPEGFEELYQQTYPNTPIRDHLAMYLPLQTSFDDESYLWKNTEDKEGAQMPTSSPYGASGYEFTTVGGHQCIKFKHHGSHFRFDNGTNEKLQLYSEPFGLQYSMYISTEQWNSIALDYGYGMAWYALPPTYNMPGDNQAQRVWVTVAHTNKAEGKIRFIFRLRSATDHDLAFIPSKEVAFSRDQWHHIYFMRNGIFVRWFLDGEDITDPNADDYVFDKDGSSFETQIHAENTDYERFGFGIFKYGIELGAGINTPISGLPCHYANVAYHIGKVPWEGDKFDPPGPNDDLLELYSEDVPVVYRPPGKMDKLMLSYRFPSGLYDGAANTYDMAFTEHISLDGNEESGYLLYMYDTGSWELGRGYGSTDIFGRWLGTYSYSRHIPFDYLPTVDSDYSDLEIGEVLTTGNGEGKCRLLGRKFGDSNVELYVTDIENPEEFDSGTFVHGSESSAYVTLSGDLVHGGEGESVKDSVVLTTRPRMVMRSGGTDKINEASLFSATAVRRIPMVYPKLSKLGVEIEANDRLAQIPTINVIVSKGYIPIRYWTGTGYSIEAKNSANPAWAVYDILTNPRYGLGLNPQNIDYASFSAWASYADDWIEEPVTPMVVAPRLRVNGIFDQKNTNTYDAIDQICQMGRARLSVVGSVYYIRVNKPEEPCAVVSSAIYDEDSMEIEWIDDQGKPDVLVIEFLNKEEQYKKDSIEIVSDDFADDPSEATRFNVETIFLPFVTSKGQAIREGTLRLKTLRSITRRYEWSMDIDGISLEVGDVILLQSESNRLSFGGKVLSVDTDAETIQIDREAFLATSIYSGNDARIIVRSNESDVIYQLSVLGPWDTTTDTFTVMGHTQSTDAVLNAISVGDPLALGRYGEELEEVRIETVSIDSEQLMRVTGFNYDASIYDIETESDTEGTEDVTGDGSYALPPIFENAAACVDYW